MFPCSRPKSQLGMLEENKKQSQGTQVAQHTKHQDRATVSWTEVFTRLDPKEDSINLLRTIDKTLFTEWRRSKRRQTRAGGNGDGHGEGCPLRSRFEPQVCCNRGKSDYWQVREQMTRVNIMEVLLAYVQVQTEELWGGFLWKNPERGNLQCKRGRMACQERRSRQEDKQVKQQDDDFPSRSRSQRYNKGASAGERELSQAMRLRRDSVEICTQGNRVKHEKRAR